MADVSVLDVLLYDEPIGTLTRVGGDNVLFAFNDAYIADENRPVLGLGFKDCYCRCKSAAICRGPGREMGARMSWGHGSIRR